MILAAIDIGSNAARLLIAEVKGNSEFTKLNLLRIPLRLGMDVFTKGKIGLECEKMLIDSMKVFSDLMKIYKVQHYRACATSAMRDAKNSDEIIEIVMETSQIHIEIISGDEEARLVYENHIVDHLDDDSDYLYIDVGGGSTELIFFKNGHLEYQKSFNIGSIRLLNHLVTQDHWNEMKNEIHRHINSTKSIIGIGSGGNINKAFSMSKTKEGKSISAAYLKNLYKDISKLSVEERMREYKLRPDRADVLEPALLIYINVFTWIGIKKIVVPKISVADGLIKNIYADLQNK